MQKRLPLGITSFKEMQDDDYIYVDKTDIIAKFVSTKGPYFLSCPRRFGKSTLINFLVNQKITQFLQDIKQKGVIIIEGRSRDTKYLIK